MPNLYHSDIHMPRWKRVVLWLVGSKPGLTLFYVTGFLLAFGPVFVVGLWWFVGVMIFLAGFCSGYALARSYARAGLEVPRL